MATPLRFIVICLIDSSALSRLKAPLLCALFQPTTNSMIQVGFYSFSLSSWHESEVELAGKRSKDGGIA